ncbi:hypothetical protein RM717_24155 [Streptomyces griseus]|uniref:Uncharacterized protein n=1 Tax=Streptomyces stephensoniae TaxID=3375367 RepID=A0ABU2W6U4_9ACTN|nr:hypothetical protein [Streptomyces griseus]MDT0493598.1 hypothetical protein [Streptomyces griseus]
MFVVHGKSQLRHPSYPAVGLPSRQEHGVGDAPREVDGGGTAQFDDPAARGGRGGVRATEDENPPPGQGAARRYGRRGRSAWSGYGRFR